MGTGESKEISQAKLGMSIGREIFSLLRERKQEVGDRKEAYIGNVN